MKKNEISMSEWKEALGELSKNDPGFTANELAKEFGISQQQMKIRLDKMAEKGLAVKGSAFRYGPSGDKHRVSVYVLKKSRK